MRPISGVLVTRVATALSIQQARPATGRRHRSGDANARQAEATAPGGGDQAWASSTRGAEQLDDVGGWGGTGRRSRARRRTARPRRSARRSRRRACRCWGEARCRAGRGGPARLVPRRGAAEDEAVTVGGGGRLARAPGRAGGAGGGVAVGGLGGGDVPVEGLHGVSPSVVLRHAPILGYAGPPYIGRTVRLVRPGLSSRTPSPYPLNPRAAGASPRPSPA